MQLITHFASGKALGNIAFCPGVDARERDREKPPFAGDSVMETVLFGVVVPAALREAANALVGRRRDTAETRAQSHSPVLL